MHNLTIFLLGSPQFLVDGAEVIGFNTRKDQALLAYLAATGATHSRETLAGLLWSDLPEANARRNLRHALSHLQKAIGPQWLVTERGVALTREQPWSVDVQTLRSALKKLMVTPTPVLDGQGATQIEALDQALQLYRGEFLQGFHVHDATHFEEWVLAQREELHLLVLRGLETLVERCLAQGAYEQGLTATRRLLQVEPWSEPGYRWQMQLLAQSGRRTEALALFAKCRAVLAAELGVEPEQATVALYAQLRDQAMAVASPPANVAAPAKLVSAANAPASAVILPLYHNLPGQLTPLVGREAEVAQVCALLARHERLVTVVGEGGVGKTRLALAVAQTFVAEAQPQHLQLAAAPTTSRPRPFPDGIVFIPLAGLTITEGLVDQVVATVAKALQLPFASKEPLFTQLQERLREKQLLLLFDNVEHLLPALADFLIELLQSAPKLTLLVTSRHLLNLQAETIVQVRGLPTPSPAEASTLTPAALLAYPSVALFGERAQRANATFQFTAANQSAIGPICHFVAGLPLAIELAATLTRRYTCRQILVELQKSYTVLNSPLRDLAARHRSIQAVLAYSWALLTPETARLLAACSIFHGSFDQAAVAAIVQAPPDALFTLVDQSLVQGLRNQDQVEQDRFALHELIRQYAAEQLATQPEELFRLHTAHCTYYLTLLIEQHAHFIHNAEALQRLQGELDNLRSAWAWAGAHGQWELLVAAAYPLREFYDLLSLFQEAENAFGQTIAQVQQGQTLAAADAAQPARALAYLQAQQAHFCAQLGQKAQAEAAAQAALVIGQRLADHAVQAYAYLALSLSYNLDGDLDKIYTAAEQAMTQARAAALPDVVAMGLHDMGCVWAYRGELHQAITYLQEAAAMSQIAHNAYHEGVIYRNLGMIYQLAGDLVQARAAFHQVTAILQQMKIPILNAHAKLALSELYLQLGSYPVAISDAQAAQELYRLIGLRNEEGQAFGNLAYAYCQLGAWTQAEQACQALFACLQPLGLTVMRPFGHFIQGELRHRQGQWQAALAAYETARQEYRTTDQPVQAASAQTQMAQVWLQLGDLAQALAQVEEILPHLSQTTQHSWLETTPNYWGCYQVLAAAGDPRAPLILEQGYRYVQTQANCLTDVELRHSYLTNVMANRALLEEAARVGIS